MPTITYHYVYFASGPHQRQPRASSGPGGFTLIQSGQVGSQDPGTTITALPVPPSWPVNGETYNFAFKTLAGAGGPPSGQTSFQADRFGPSATVGDSPVQVLVVYAPSPGGPPNNGSGATIDAYDEATASLFDDTFVSVSPDPDRILTLGGNVEGYVDTTNSAETITALSPTLGYPPGTPPANVGFDFWYLLGAQVSPTGLHVEGANLTVSAGTSVSALAFYQASPTPPPPTLCQTLLENFNALSPAAKTDVVVLEYYRQMLCACHGPQYTAACKEINGLLAELRNPLR